MPNATAASTRTPRCVPRSRITCRPSPAIATANTPSSDEHQQHPTGRVHVAAERRERRRPAPERAHRRAPRRPGVMQLVEERRHPRRERERADARARRGPRAARARSARGRRHAIDRDGHDRDGEQRERPVVRVEQQAGDDRHRREPDRGSGARAPAPPRGSRARRAASRSAYIRASVEYRIANGESARSSSALHATTSGLSAGASPSRRRRSSRRRPMNHIGTSVRVPATPDSARTAVGPDPEDPHPAVEEQVVERRRAVVAQRRHQPVERQPGDVDREHLVGPHVRLAHEPQDHAEREDTERRRGRAAASRGRGARRSDADSVPVLLVAGVAAPRGDSHAHRKRLPPRGVSDAHAPWRRRPRASA